MTMEITAVRYRKLVSRPGFTNEAIEAEAAVEVGENPEDVLLQLADWVNAHLDGRSCHDIQTLKQDLQILCRQCEQLRAAKIRGEAELQVQRDKLDELTKLHAEASAEAKGQPLLKLVKE
jgi:hypothetical protein